MLKRRGKGNGIGDGFLQQMNEPLRLGRELAVFPVNPPQVDAGLALQGNGNDGGIAHRLGQKSAAGGESVGPGQDVHGGGAVIDADAFGWFFQRDHGIFLEKVRGNCKAPCKR